MSKILNIVVIIFYFVSGMLFGIIKRMQHLCGVASMIVSPEGALSPEGLCICSMSVR